MIDNKSFKILFIEETKYEIAYIVIVCTDVLSPFKIGTFLQIFDSTDK